MPGAFEYLDPTAPTPDPDVLMSGLPYRAPYAHVPTTGDLRNPNLPTDTTRDRIAQGVYDASPLALGPAAYSAATNLGEGIRDGDVGQGAQGAFEAMFLGLPAASRLVAAGKIKPGGRGSPEMLERAKESWGSGADPRKVWDETGWASGEEFGAFSDGRAPNPVMWHGAPDLALRNTAPGIQRGTMDELVGGIDDLKIAEPGLADMQIKTRLNDTLPIEDVGGSVGVTREPNSYEALKKKNMQLEAQVPSQIEPLLFHEMQHAVDDLSSIDLRAGTGKAPVYGTEAERLWDTLADDALLIMQNPPPGMPSRVYDKVRDLGSQARSFNGKAPEHASYLNAPQELKARAAQDIYSFGTPEQKSQGVYPGDIDMWSNEAFHPITPPGYETFVDIAPPTWRDYMRPKTK